jgi:hypothetical protein
MAGYTKVNLKDDVEDELIAVGAPNTGPGDADVENDWWSE